MVKIKRVLDGMDNSINIASEALKPNIIECYKPSVRKVFAEVVADNIILTCYVNNFKLDVELLFNSFQHR